MAFILFRRDDWRFSVGEGLAFQSYLDVDWERGGFYVNRSISKTINGQPFVKPPRVSL